MLSVHRFQAMLLFTGLKSQVNDKPSVKVGIVKHYDYTTHEMVSENLSRCIRKQEML